MQDFVLLHIHWISLIVLVLLFFLVKWRVSEWGRFLRREFAQPVEDAIVERFNLHEERAAQRFEDLSTANKLRSIKRQRVIGVAMAAGVVTFVFGAVGLVPGLFLTGIGSRNVIRMWKELNEQRDLVKSKAASS